MYKQKTNCSKLTQLLRIFWLADTIISFPKNRVWMVVRLFGSDASFALNKEELRNGVGRCSLLQQDSIKGPYRQGWGEKET